MTNIKFIFAVCLLAVLGAGNAFADVASTAYVDALVPAVATDTTPGLVIVDKELSAASEHPVSNSAVFDALSGKADLPTDASSNTTVSNVGGASLPVYVDDKVITPVTGVQIPVGGATYDPNKGWATIWVE